MRVMRRVTAIAGLAVLLVACDEDDADPPRARDAATAPRASIDRFSDAAATLFRRSQMASLPAPNASIDFDQGPFITHGLGPAGEPVRYYNLDVMPEAPAPIFVLIREGETEPVAGQLNIVDVIPGDAGYSDFWQVVRVMVPRTYVANTVTSYAAIQAAGFPTEVTTTLVNCPIVPAGSTADEGGGARGLVQGWYRDQVVFYFDFNEAPLAVTGAGRTPTAPIFVTFNTNPDEPGGGPASGFRTQNGSLQTHNVIATLPGQPGYSPLWNVIPYDNAAFGAVHDLASAQAAANFGTAALVNCPVVFVGQAPADPDDTQQASIDRFSDAAAMLFRRSAMPTLPAANAPIDMDLEPFITHGLGPNGELARYYNFDVQPRTPAPIYVLIHEGTGEPVVGQLNIVDAVPGDPGYNDFMQVVLVVVPDGYIANTVTSAQQILAAGYVMQPTRVIADFPIVPAGSTAQLGSGSAGLTRGWYRGQIVFHFAFGDALLQTATGEVPTSPIFVAFNINPDQPGGGPASGFVTESGTVQTHNVLATLPGQTGYSPLWEVVPYDNASFATVFDLSSAISVPNFGVAALVNCPVVFVQ